MNSTELLGVLIWQLKKVEMKIIEDLRRLVESPAGINLAHILKSQFGLDLAQAENQIKQLRRHHIRLVTLFDNEYPSAFLQCPNPPYVLSYVGEWIRPAAPITRLGVVGTRRVDRDLTLWLEQTLEATASQVQLGVLSGGARGVDSIAHQIALRRQNPTWMFLPSGILRPYPADRKSWYQKICDAGGGIISQFAPEQSMNNFHFHLRNQVLAAASEVLLVVAAGLKSGTRITARCALDLGVPLGVVPGSPWDPRFGYSLSMLESGAHAIHSADDLIDLLRETEGEGPKKAIE